MKANSERRDEGAEQRTEKQESTGDKLTVKRKDKNLTQRAQRPERRDH